MRYPRPLTEKLLDLEKPEKSRMFLRGATTLVLPERDVLHQAQLPCGLSDTPKVLAAVV